MMKKMKSILWLMSLIVITTFSACIEDDGVRERILMLRPVMSNNFTSVEFEDMAGLRYVPSKMILSSPKSELAYVHFDYNQKDLYNNPKSISINVITEPFYITENPVEEIFPELEESTQHSVHNCDALLWGKDYLVLAADLFLNKNTAEDKLAEELNNIHNFSLHYNPNEEMNQNTLKFKLRYEISGTEMTEDELRATYNIEFSDTRYFDIRNTLQEYKTKNGNFPTRIEIEYYKADYISVVDNSWRTEKIILDLQ